jgi:tRNA(Arg) A34 adenosine deaminase TadA
MPEPQVTQARLWAGLDDAWREAFRQAWEAFRSGNIPVGACATTPDGVIVHSARNRVADRDGPVGEVFGSALAHAEVNVLARVGFGQPRRLILTTTLEPCLQCSAVIRLGPVATVRYAGADPLWDGCHDFSPLSPREAAQPKAAVVGPRADEVGVFGTLIARFGPGLSPGAVADYLRAAGEGPVLDLVRELQDSGEARDLAAMEVDQAFGQLWPRLRELSGPQAAASRHRP